jgi:hypothetical protein
MRRGVYVDAVELRAWEFFVEDSGEEEEKNEIHVHVVRSYTYQCILYVDTVTCERRRLTGSSLFRSSIGHCLHTLKQ